MRRGSGDRYGQNSSGKLVAEGVEARVPYKGMLADVVFQLMGGLRSGMGYLGARNLQELREKARFVQITSGGLKESHPTTSPSRKNLSTIPAKTSLMDDKHLVAVIDFGSQYTQLIVRRVRELGYMAKLYALEDLDQIHEPGAVILSGGPKSTTDADAPDIDFNWLQSLNVPVLGVCYGMQLLNIKHGGSVKASNKREYGPAALIPESLTGLYQDMSPSSQVWMSHSDTVDHLAEGCRVIARNAEGFLSPCNGETTFGIQFHPEVTHSHEGRTILRNFLSCAANLKKFDIGDFKRELIREIRERVGDKQVVCGVSGGVDSTVLAVLLHEAGVNMRAIFVDNGLLRKNEADEVRANFARMGVKIETVDASERFLTALAGEETRKKAPHHRRPVH